MKTIFDNPEILLRELRAGNQAALKYIYDELYLALCFYANHIVRIKADAEDIVADVFIKFWEKRMDFEAKDKAEHWLFKVTRNKCKNFIRGNKRERKKKEGYEKDQERNSKETDVTAFESRLLSADIRESFGNLPEKMKALLEYKREGKTVEEIAVLKGVAPKTIKNTLYKAYKILRNNGKKGSDNS